MTSQTKHLGKYQILEELGKGGFATVFRARDPDLERDVALKVMDPLLMRDPVWVQRFRQEAKAIARLKHPRIITIHEIGQSEGVLYIATELVEGGSLADRIAKEGRMIWEETVQLVGEIADALGYAHSQGVLHRDMKPANVLLDPSTGAILTDFGFARIVADHSLSVSMSGGVVGTPAYIAPEVWHGDKATAQTDIYALGCILYEIVTGKELFTGATPPAVMLAHFQPPALPSAWPDDVPPGLTEVLDKTLAREPDQRYGSAGELANALAALNIDRLSEPYAALERAINDEDWQKAQTLVEEIQAADPDYRDVVALAQQAQAGLEEAAKQQQITKLREKAEQALTAGDWQNALAVVDELKAADLESEDAAVLEQKALAGMEEDARKQQAAQWKEALEAALEAGNLEAAELALAQWEGLGVQDDRIETFRQSIDQMQESTPEQQKPHEPILVTGFAPIDHPADKQPRRPKGESQIYSSASDNEVQEKSSISFWVFVIPLVLVGIAMYLIGIAMTPDQRPMVVEKIVTVTPIPLTSTPDPALGIDATRISSKDGMEMVYVPDGEFLMGSPAGEGSDNERPQHTVYLDAFWIDKTEVANVQYQKCVDVGGCQEYMSYASVFYGPNYPVVGVSWNDASAYCQWAGRRLPTEAEWEKATRGTDGRIYPWGDEFDCSRGNFDDETEFDGYVVPGGEDCDSYARAAPVGSYPAGASPYGALDMAGNVWEWVEDLYDDEYYSELSQHNPTGPVTGNRHVKRGGSWVDLQNAVRSTVRSASSPVVRNYNTGFRCALSDEIIGSSMLFEVQANQDWQSTNVSVNERDTIKIEYISGSWSAWGDHRVAPFGSETSDGILNEVSWTGVIGKVESDPFFPINFQDDVVASKAGKLYLRINDPDVLDNTGSVTVSISIE